MREMTTTHWPTLTGSPKQIAWAETIRQEKITALVTSLTRSLTDLPGAARTIDTYVTAALRPTTARHWIDFRQSHVPVVDQVLAYYATQADRDTIRTLTRRAADLRHARDQIATLRQRGLTVRQIAARIGVHTSTVYRWAAARAVPSHANGVRLAELDTATRPVTIPAWRRRLAAIKESC